MYARFSKAGNGHPCVQQQLTEHTQKNFRQSLPRGVEEEREKNQKGYWKALCVID